jgi:phosphoesterase RecJ-like protein
LLAVDTVKVAVLIRQLDDNTFKASFRSMDGIDISVAAKSIGGGGHKQAAGAAYTSNLSEAINVVLEAIEKADI